MRSLPGQRLSLQECVTGKTAALWFHQKKQGVIKFFAVFEKQAQAEMIARVTENSLLFAQFVRHL
ncbi:hypothetical protein [Pseudomonas sp. KCJK8993]|uniref:hypothetical protein n=1 Tax=Pseudomonas sp. KCJK8993 TaxID=3344565 RepID=UPI003905AEB1